MQIYYSDRSIHHTKAQTIAIKIDRDRLYYRTIVLLCYPIHRFMVIYKYNNKWIYSSTNEFIKYSSDRSIYLPYIFALVPYKAFLIATLGYSTNKPLIGLKSQNKGL